MKKYNIPDLGTKCSAYTEEFNISDEECYANDIPNSGADAYLMSNIPLFECPDKTIEKTYFLNEKTLKIREYNLEFPSFFRTFVGE